jgi:ABC-type methionine transport system ATPase subunit
MASAKLLLNFPLTKISEPVFTHLVTDFDVRPNLLAANVDASKGGWLLLGLEGTSEMILHATDWIRSIGVTVSEESLA